MFVCDSVEYYADPLRPDCTGFGTADGVSCEGGEATTACSSAALISIRTVDRSVRLIKSYELPVPASMDELEGKAHLADMFSLDQQPAVVFTNKIVVASCRDPEHASKPACAQRLQPPDHGGHRRTQQGTSCTHADFIQRDSDLLTACGFDLGYGTAQLSSGMACPSLDCADQLAAVLSDCAVAASRGGNALQAAFYAALGASPLRTTCTELSEATSTLFVSAQPLFFLCVSLRFAAFRCVSVC